jgi:hypothetical protein
MSGSEGSRYALRRDVIVSASHLAAARGSIMRERRWITMTGERRIAGCVGRFPTLNLSYVVSALRHIFARPDSALRSTEVLMAPSVSGTISAVG